MTVPVRVSVAVFAALLIAYYAMRLAASACTGSACDAFIPLSLLLPALALVAAAVTGVLAIRIARGHGGAWVTVLIGATLISCAGPIVALAVFRDAPNMFVPVATVLLIVGPAAALIYSFAVNPRQN